MLIQILVSLYRSAQAAPAPARQAELSAQLMESAEASAGQDPHRAAELRSAALAYLGVVR